MALAILQARMSSSRLPGKVLAPLAGAPMILRQIERLRRTRTLERIVVATSTRADDDPLAQAVTAAGVPVHRGDLDDVLGRFIGALDAFGPVETVVRLTADCPLADPDVIDATIDRFHETGADYVSNVAEPRTFPKGLDVEVMKAAALRRAASETADPYDREHVTPYLYRHPERFRLAAYAQATGEGEGEVRWTVDRPDDLVFVRAVYDALYPITPAFSSADVRALVRDRPDLATLGGDRRV
jgi:spore coat polysaccharide biosynthesis protein SpsF